MARPRKQSLDYFPLDTEMDEKIEYIQELHGIVGFGVIIRLFQTIYKKSYFINWGKVEKVLFKKITGVDINLVDEIIKDCLEIGLFSKDLFNKYNILTSKGIQKRYYEVARKREKVEITREYVLFRKLLSCSCEVSDEFPTQKPDGNSEEIPTRAGKVKNSIAKNSESKEQQKESKEDGEADANADIGIFEFLEKEFGRPIRSAEFEELSAFENDLPKELIQEAIKRAVINQATKVPYVTSILHQWKLKGFTCLAQVLQEDQEFQRRKKGKRKAITNSGEIKTFSDVYDKRMKRQQMQAVGSG